MDDKQKIQMLSYSLGLAIGALETINAVPYDFNKDGLQNILRRLKEMAETPTVMIDSSKGGAGE